MENRSNLDQSYHQRSDNQSDQWQRDPNCPPGDPSCDPNCPPGDPNCGPSAQQRFGSDSSGDQQVPDSYQSHIPTSSAMPTSDYNRDYSSY